MGKKVFSLCMALALCLSLLPATALAEENAPTTLYVGDQSLPVGQDSCWTTDANTGKLTEYITDGDEWTVKYEPTSATLTLKNATIKGEVNAENIASAGIYAASSSGPVSLNIVLVGENEVTGGYGINVSSGGAASLSITGSGSLTVSATAANGIGIFVQARSDANLTIDGANVNAVVTETNGRGVELSTGQADNPNLTIEVKGGSLQASGQPNGIKFFTNADNTCADANLKVSGNAMVKTSGITTDADGSGSQGADLTTEAGSGETGGIVFDGNTGTVYGSVTLQGNLEIKSGETLTIGNGASLTVPSGKTLTNNGTVTTTGSGTLTNSGTINNSGTLTGSITNAPPKITTTSLPDGKEYTAYNETLQADNDPTQWSVTSGSLPAGLTLGTSTGVISGTPTVDGTFNFTVKATNGGGSDSRAFTLMVNAAPTGPAITAQPSNVTVAAGGAATFSVTATGSNLNYQWQQSTDGGQNWADISGANSATYTIENTTTAMSGYQYRCVVTGNGGSVTSDAATLTVTAPPEPEPEPKPTPPPYIPPSKPNWTSVARKLANAQPGDTVTVKMNGETEVPGEVWETIAGRDVTVILDMGGNVSWTVDGNDVPTATHFADMDFGVDRNTTGIDVDVINAITGQVSSVQITLAHDGEFGFTLTLTAPLGRENAGSWANLYHYDEDAESLSYETSGEIQEDGTASLKMTHASQYAIIIDEQTHQLPFEDVASGAWYEGTVRYAYLHDIMEGMSATTFQPNGTLSRAMAVQIFYNLEGQPDLSDENLGYPYEDVDAQAWYGNAVYWARITGVATGYGDGTFQPTDSITRQEFAQMLYNYAKYKGYDLTAEGDLSTFPDAGSIADWAKVAMSWANGNELINGHDDGTIDAGGAGTRAQAASILMRFDQTIRTE